MLAMLPTVKCSVLPTKGCARVAIVESPRVTEWQTKNNLRKEESDLHLDRTEPYLVNNNV